MSNNFTSFIHKIIYEFLYYCGIIEKHVKNFINIFQEKTDCLEPIINVKAVKFDHDKQVSEIKIACQTIHDFQEKESLIKDLILEDDTLILIENEKEEIIIFNGEFSKLEEIMTSYFNDETIFHKTNYNFLSFIINFKDEKYEVNTKPYFFVNNDVGNIYFIAWLLSTQFNRNYSFFKDNYTLTIIDHEANLMENVIFKSIVLEKTKYKTIH